MYPTSVAESTIWAQLMCYIAIVSITWPKFRLTTRGVVIGSCTTIAILAFVQIVSFFWPRHLTFVYDSATCTTNPLLFPSFVVPAQSASFQPKLSGVTKLFGYPVYASGLCIVAVHSPRAGATETATLRLFGSTILRQSLHVTSATPPQLNTKSTGTASVAVDQPLGFTLSTTDHIYSYQLVANNRQIDCTVTVRKISCPVPKLDLAQSAKYRFVLWRTFHSLRITAIFDQTIATVEDIHVVSSSIAPGQTVYGAPTDITLTLNRPATTIAGASITQVSGSTRTPLAATATVSGNVVTLRPEHPLPRSATIAIAVTQIIAADRGRLPTPYALTFQTSSGPKVLGASIGSYGIDPSAAITVRFDSAILSSQAFSQFVRLEVGGQAVGVGITASGTQITIRPSAPLPRCTPFTLRVLDGLQNQAGIAGGSAAWQHSSRTICQTVFSIGASVQGRNLTAYRFGTGPSQIVYVANMHGNEKSSTYLLNRWIDYLEANYDRIPASRTIVVLPTDNPDGFAANRRTNAHGVDINRNFPSNDWTAGVAESGTLFLPAGGGAAPLSEPESAALASYISTQRPRLVLSYHAAGGIVLPNGSGDSMALAQMYDQKSTVSYLPDNQSSGFFGYAITGAFEGWAYDHLGLPVLLIELRTQAGDEFSGNQNAMWAMATLP
jgi:hypothetical protein